VPADHHRDDAFQGGDVGERVTVDDEQVGIEARPEPACAVGEHR
jgi:hypothetical protein